MWTFERFIDYELRGFVRETHRNVSKTDCEDFCLSESRFARNSFENPISLTIFLFRFSCRSASYDHLTQECYLSEQDRFTQPEAFRPRQGSDYLENQCESRQSRCDFSPQTRGQYLIYTDKSTQAFSDSQCRQACSAEREFTCRSYSFLPEVGIFFEIKFPACKLYIILKQIVYYTLRTKKRWEFSLKFNLLLANCTINCA